MFPIAAIFMISLQLNAFSQTITLVTRGTDYYVSNDGDDSNNGTSANYPWETLNKVNSFAFQPGDTIHFKCGDTWRGQLLPVSGSLSGTVKYTTYGSGNKPIIMGSVSRNNTSDWTNLDTNIWGVVPSVTSITGSELIYNTGFESSTTGWNLYYNTNNGANASGSRITTDKYEGNACYCMNVTSFGSTFSSIQFFMSNLSVEKDKIYRLSFAAKSSANISMNTISLMKNTSPYTLYSGTAVSPQLTADWKVYTYYFKSNDTASDARINFYLGAAYSSSANVYFDSISFKQCEVSNFIESDVGNIILDGLPDLCVKKSDADDITSQNDFCFDRTSQILKMYSVQNPASLYSSIECALSNAIIDETSCSYVEYDGLYLTQGGGHGIGGGSIANITVKNCDISFIGGCYQSAGTSLTRYGNGIELWGSANNITIECCNIWEIYDAAITPQCNVTNDIYNIYIRYNNLRNFEYGLELWSSPSTSTLHDVYFEYNVLKNAGDGWAHAQRPAQAATFIMLYSSASAASNIYIRYNTFDSTAQYCIWRNGSTWNGISSVVIDYNTYHITSDKLFYWQAVNYDTTEAGINSYISASGKESNSTFYVY